MLIKLITVRISAVPHVINIMLKFKIAPVANFSVQQLMDLQTSISTIPSAVIPASVVQSARRIRSLVFGRASQKVRN